MTRPRRAAFPLREPPPWEEPGSHGAYVGAAFSIPMLRFPFHVGVSRGALVSAVESVLAWDRAQRPVARALRRVELIANPATYLALAAFLIALGVAPRPEPVAEAAWTITVTVIEMFVTGLAVAVCLDRAWHAVGARDLRGAIVSAVFVLITAGLAALANALGLLDGWLAIIDWVGDLL